MTNEQFINMLKGLIKETMGDKKVLLETPSPKKTIREKMRERAKTRQSMSISMRQLSSAAD
jgi:vacuolar-type H+-ATPase subunit F/Vma7